MTIEQALMIAASYGIQHGYYTHFILEEEYCLLFNKDTMSGLECSGDYETQYYVELWNTNESFIELHLKNSQVLTYP